MSGGKSAVPGINTAFFADGSYGGIAIGILCRIHIDNSPGEHFGSLCVDGVKDGMTGFISGVAFDRKTVCAAGREDKRMVFFEFIE